METPSDTDKYPPYLKLVISNDHPISHRPKPAKDSRLQKWIQDIERRSGFIRSCMKYIRMTIPNRARVVLLFEGRSLEAMLELCRRTEANSFGEVIKEALKHYDQSTK